ncbi:MAG: translation initiation factor IF-2 [Ruminococcaceae bacterium]|nr:translation initiation factor IF-2 [Oscillospiraceae bacterium]
MAKAAAKIKITDIAKNFGMAGKDMLALIKEFGIDKKSSTSGLEAEELNLVFEHMLNRLTVEGDIEPLLTKGVSSVEEKKGEKAPKDEQSEKPEQAEEKAPSKKKKQKEESSSVEEPKEEPVAESAEPQQDDTPSYVNTRADDVDLKKFEDEEKIEELVEGIKDDDTQSRKQKIKKGAGKTAKSNKPLEQKQHKKAPEKKEKIHVLVPAEITVGELAERIDRPATELIKNLMMLGQMANVNESIDYDTASLILDDMGFETELEIIVTKEDILFNDTDDAPEDLVSRPPVVVVMGHVDHGKTSLLDAIRKTSVTSTEAGGITQHIGAYKVHIKGRDITFLDTPGHEAFTAMRLRGAQVTDVAILVVAADDGIMPQTVEAINHAKAAGVDIVVAINKIDKPEANIERVKQELTEHDLVPEEWGGSVICVPVSALTGENIDDLLETVLLVADIKELKANPNRRAKGSVIEAKLDKARGVVATVLVQNGTLHSGDLVVAGNTMGKVRAMTDYKGKKVKEAPPSTPVEILGLGDVPVGGDTFYVVENERMAKEVIEARKFKEKNEMLSARKKVSLDDLFSQINEGEVKDLNIIVKADVQGSVEAVKQSLVKLTNEEVRVNIIHGAVGAVNESDVMLADASNAIIVGFNVRPTPDAASSADEKGVDMRLYRVIYEAIEEIEAAMKGMLAPKYKEAVTGHAEIRQTFRVSGVGTIAGVYITDGKIGRGSLIRIVRDGIVVYDGSLSSLKRFKDDAKEVAQGYECGMSFEKFNDIKEGDVVEAYIMEEIER